VSISQRRSAHFLFSTLGSPRAAEPHSSPRVLLLAAHPDDETIGASALLGRLKNVVVAFLTDGAPRDPAFRSSLVNGTRESYAAIRAQEAARAMELVGLGPDRIRFLGGVDQESICELPRLLESLFDLIQDVRPAFIVTHPYEGGHPDHDTAALITYLSKVLAEQRGLEAPELLEMTSYHAAEGSRIAGMFLPGEGPTIGITLSPTPFERAIKARMLNCYVSQRAVLSDFPLEPERLRVAPRYDFAQPPHQGVLWYECLKWPMTGAHWREAAVRAFENFGYVSCH
jgi:LmbE family N-acetylglucosaminyl deacetylase